MNFCYLSTIQIMWAIFIHVIIEVMDISLTSKACFSSQVHIHNFHFVIVSILLEWLYAFFSNTNRTVNIFKHYKLKYYVV